MVGGDAENNASLQNTSTLWGRARVGMLTTELVSLPQRFSLGWIRWDNVVSENWFLCHSGFHKGGLDAINVVSCPDPTRSDSFHSTGFMDFHKWTIECHVKCNSELNLSSSAWLSLSLTYSLSLSKSAHSSSLKFYLSVSFSHSISPCSVRLLSSLSLTHSIPLSSCLSVCLSFKLFLISLSPSLLPFSLCMYLSISLSLSVPYFYFLSIPLSVSLSLSPSLYPSFYLSPFSMSLSPSLSVLCLYPYPSIFIPKYASKSRSWPRISNPNHPYIFCPTQTEKPLFLPW